jgi:hypothetical protein
MPRVTSSQAQVNASSSEVPVGVWLRSHKNAALQLLGLPVRGVEKLGEAVQKWLEPGPKDENDTAWMHTTDFGSDRVRQEVIDAWWEDRESARRVGKDS